jgi:hypothetical protein
MEVADQIIEEERDEPIEETIRNAIRGTEAVETAPVVSPVIEDKPADTAVRDAEGKFAAAPKVKRETLTVPKPAENAPIDNVVQLQPATPAIKAPDGWKAELKAKFPELPPEVQAEIARRETDMHKALTRQDEERTFAKRVNEIVSPYLPTIRAEGGTPEKAIESLLQTAHTLRNGNDYQKAQNVAAVIQQFKVDPQVLFSILQGGNVNTGVPLQQAPYTQAAIQPHQVTELVQAELAKQHQIQEQHTLQSQIEAFASDPAHPHFERVKVLMGSLLETGEAADLEDAYNQACYAKPDIRSSLTALQQQAANDQRTTEARAKAEAAKRAGGSVTGGPGSAKALKGPGTDVPLEETIRAAIRESSGRV